MFPRLRLWILLVAMAWGSAASRWELSTRTTDLAPACVQRLTAILVNTCQRPVVALPALVKADLVHPPLSTPLTARRHVPDAARAPPHYFS